MNPGTLGRQDHAHTCVLWKTKLHGKKNVFKTSLQHKHFPTH